MAEDELFRDGSNTPISPIEEAPEGHEHYGHEFHDAEEIERSPAPTKKGNNLAAIIAGGGVAVLMFGFMGYQIYSKIAKKSGGEETYQAVAVSPAQLPGDATPMRDPYEQPASLPAAAPQPAEPIAVAQVPTELAQPVPPPAQSASPITYQAEATVPAATTPASVPVISTQIDTSQRHESADAAAAKSNLDKRVDAIESRLGNIEKQITDVANSIKAQKPTISAAVNATKANAAKKPAASKPVAKTKSDHEEGVPSKSGKYQILSVLAGQAWVEETTSGEVEIVRVGETLSSGATVTKINSAEGTVVTNRGIIGK